MKKYFLVALMCLCSGSMLYAQSSMTDKQIVEYIQKQHAAGKDNATIGRELVARGVDIERLQRLKEKYEREGLVPGAVDLRNATTDKQRTENRLRGNNGVNQRTSRPTNRSEWSAERRKEYDATQGAAMGDLLDGFAPDSIGYVLNVQEGKRVFGRDIFNNNMLSFEPNENVATPDNYRLGAGDVVYIDVWGASSVSMQSTVSPDGTIIIDGMGPVTVGGMTVANANAYLSRELQSIYQGSNVRVTVGQTKTIGVNVMGEVVVPGTYTLSAFATAFHALYVAGGVNETGTLRDIRVLRNGRQKGSVDVYDYILHGRTATDIRLQDGDVIYVGPYSSLVEIDGKVKRPMFYELKSDETLATLLGFAGNFTGDAYQKTVRVIRKSGYDYSIHTVEEFDFGAFKMMDGDSVSVEGIIPRFSNMVEVRGAVFRPGMYQMDGKVKTVRDLLVSIDGVTEDALKNRAMIYRMRDDRTREVKSFNLGALLDGTAGDIPLKNEDIIFIFDQKATLSGRTVSVSGCVHYPGIYEYAAGTSITDILLQAGGLLDNASRQHIEVSRRIKDASAAQKGNEITQIFSFALNEDLTIEGGQDFFLEPYDVVYVRRSPVWNDSRSVTVEGEVNYAGSFPLQNKNDRLSDLINRAGGITQNAYVAGAHLQRVMSDEDIERKQALIRLARTSADSIDLSTLDLARTYTVGIDLEAALTHPGSDADMILKDGDRLVVPEIPGLIKVNGAVMYPNAVAWIKGKKAAYYIKQAGGFSSKAKRRRAFVVNLNGTVQRASKAGALLEGSEIVVPTRDERRKLSTSEIVTIGTSTASLATMVATIVSLLK